MIGHPHTEERVIRYIKALGSKNPHQYDTFDRCLFNLISNYIDSYRMSAGVQSTPSISSRAPGTPMPQSMMQNTQQPSNSIQPSSSIRLPHPFKEGRKDTHFLVYVNVPCKVEAVLYKVSGEACTNPFKIINERLKGKKIVLCTPYTSLARIINDRYGVRVSNKTTDPGLILQSCTMLGIHCIIYDEYLLPLKVNTNSSDALEMIFHEKEYYLIMRYT